MSIMSTGAKLLYPTDESRASLTINEGPLLFTDTWPAGLGASTTYASRLVTLGKPDGERHRGCIITPLLDDSDHAENDTMALDLFGINPIMDPASPNAIIGLWVDKLADITVTAVADANVIAKSKLGNSEGGNYRPCDAISITGTGLHNALDDVFEPGITAYEPGSNGTGLILAPDAFGYWALAFDHAGNEKFNALVQALT